MFALRLERLIKSSPHAAYEAFTDPAHLSRWFTSSARAELVIGGRYSNADGDQGTFLMLDPPRLIEFTWENEKHCPNTIVTVSFSPTADGAVTVTLEHSHLASQADYEDMNGGWSWALDSLQSYLEAGRPISHEDWLKSHLQR
jgi:uncharacterized protein YndB with AHSA1/START domain